MSFLAVIAVAAAVHGLPQDGSDRDRAGCHQS